ncbi:hypothetical protein ACPV36_05060 [Photobacterium damselae]|uniref:hypothetical protein n=1 Tax=Photobacterium damselae TaxID=38293 RepID=UPI00406852D7
MNHITKQKGIELLNELEQKYLESGDIQAAKEVARSRYFYQVINIQSQLNEKE